MSAVSLKQLHQDFAHIAADDCLPYPTAGFQHRLEQLRETHQHLNRVTGELRDVSGALDLVLQLLGTAEAQPIYPDSLHCLLGPLHEKMKRALGGLDEVV
ncbi:DUF1484 family protein [Pseudomonas sp. Marseille-Q5115]|uniref:DUF1484 family protein n=1 Tax=Pseudomonas sp. Marseille-Q5115 TaxID=2866593 RepID=UPI001CE3C4A8|nr:DUF1484 family protein [Pseudomonas sp. Marseille-Q5115]